MPLEIRDLRLDDRHDVAQWLDVTTRSIRVLRPRHASRGLEAAMAMLSRPSPDFEANRLVAVEDGATVASGACWIFTSGDLDKASIEVQVAPDHRGRGIGRAMADALEARTDRPVLVAEADHDGRWPECREARFSEARGYRVGTRYTARSLPWPPDPALLDALERPTPGYRIQTWVDGLPQPLQGPFGLLAGLVDADAPSGEVEWAAEPLSPDTYRADLEAELAGGGRRVETLAFHDATGNLVAFTSTSVPSNPDRFMHVNSTYVHREHRGHGLGQAVKVAMERQLLAMDLPHPSLDTGNDDENVWMVRVNELLGFVPSRHSVALVKRR